MNRTIRGIAVVLCTVISWPAPALQPAEPAPQPPTEAAPALPAQSEAARIVLRPRFELGQRTVVRHTAQKSRLGTMEVSSRIEVEVIEVEPPLTILRWRLLEIETPEGLSPQGQEQFRSVVGSFRLPDLEIQFVDEIGVTGLRNWEAARDESLMNAEKMLRATRGAGGEESDEETIANTIRITREKLFVNREQTELLLLKQVRPFFDFAFHEAPPGEAIVEDSQTNWPFGGPASSISLPLKQTVRIDTGLNGNPDIAELTFHAVPDKAALKEALESLIKSMAESAGVAPPELPTADDVELETSCRWVIDTRLGWPSEVQARNHTTFAGAVVEEKHRWTLIEGPTKLPRPEKPPASFTP